MCQNHLYNEQESAISLLRCEQKFLGFPQFHIELLQYILLYIRHKSCRPHLLHDLSPRPFLTRPVGGAGIVIFASPDLFFKAPAVHCFS